MRWRAWNNARRNNRLIFPRNFLFFHPIFIFVFLPHQRVITELIGIRWWVPKRRYREIVEHSTRRWNTIPKCLFFISRFLFVYLFFCSDTASVESRRFFSVVWQSQLSKDDWNGHGIHARLSTKKKLHVKPRKFFHYFKNILSRVKKTHHALTLVVNLSGINTLP